MPGLMLQHPIPTPDNQLLFPPGILLTEKMLDAVIDSHRFYPSRVLSDPLPPFLNEPIDELAGNTDFSRDTRQVADLEPAGLFDLIIIE